MKKTNAIQLVLITAAMAACNRPLYQQRTEGFEDPGYFADTSAGVPTDPSALTAGPGAAAPVTDAEEVDSTNSCPVESSFLPPDYYNWYNINLYYTYRNPPPPVRVQPIRSLFTRVSANIAAAHEAMSSHPALRTMANHRMAAGNMPASNHPAVARSGFGARTGAAHS